MSWFDDAIAEIEREHGGSVEAEDIATLQGKSEADRAAYLEDLGEKQDRREASTSHRSSDSQGEDGTVQNPIYSDDPRTEPGYGVSQGTYAGVPATRMMSLGQYGGQSGTGSNGIGGHGFSSYGPTGTSLGAAYQYTPFTEEFV